MYTPKRARGFQTIGSILYPVLKYIVKMCGYYLNFIVIFIIKYIKYKITYYISINYILCKYKIIY